MLIRESYNRFGFEIASTPAISDYLDRAIRQSRRYTIERAEIEFEFVVALDDRGIEIEVGRDERFVGIIN